MAVVRQRRTGVGLAFKNSANYSAWYNISVLFGFEEIPFLYN